MRICTASRTDPEVVNPSDVGQDGGPPQTQGPAALVPDGERARSLHHEVIAAACSYDSGQQGLEAAGLRLGLAAYRVRGAGLVKHLGHKSFEAYCRSLELPVSTSRLRQLIGSAEIATILAPDGVDRLVAAVSERTLRMLVPLRKDPEGVRSAWAAAGGTAEAPPSYDRLLAEVSKLDAGGRRKSSKRVSPDVAEGRLMQAATVGAAALGAKPALNAVVQALREAVGDAAVREAMDAVRRDLEVETDSEFVPVLMEV